MGKRAGQEACSLHFKPLLFYHAPARAETQWHLTCSREELDHHLHSTYSDATREENLGEFRTLIDSLQPTFDFNSMEPRCREIQEVIKASKASSAPGPSRVPYKVYKRCPKFLHQLWKIGRVI